MQRPDSPSRDQEAACRKSPRPLGSRRRTAITRMSTGASRFPVHTSASVSSQRPRKSPWRTSSPAVGSANAYASARSTYGSARAEPISNRRAPTPADRDAPAFTGSRHGRRRASSVRKRGSRGMRRARWRCADAAFRRASSGAGSHDMRRRSGLLRYRRSTPGPAIGPHDTRRRRSPSGRRTCRPTCLRRRASWCRGVRDPAGSRAPHGSHRRGRRAPFGRPTSRRGAARVPPSRGWWDGDRRCRRARQEGRRTIPFHGSCRRPRRHAGRPRRRGAADRVGPGHTSRTASAFPPHTPTGCVTFVPRRGRRRIRAAPGPPTKQGCLRRDNACRRSGRSSLPIRGQRPLLRPRPERRPRCHRGAWGDRTSETCE